MHDCVPAHAVVTDDVPVRITAVGTASAQGIMDRVLGDSAAHDVPPMLQSAFLVSADVACGAPTSAREG
jgi:hypothetical protein